MKIQSHPNLKACSLYNSNNNDELLLIRDFHSFITFCGQFFA